MAGNGTADLVSITSDNGATGSTTVRVLFGDGHGNFQSPVSQQTFSRIYPGPSYLADLDGDGKLDLVLAVQSASGTDGTLIWLKNTGGAFTPPATLGTYSGNYRYFAIADFYGNGKPDILYTAAADSSFHILINQGGGQFKDQIAGGLNGISGLATVLDFNLDGIPDLIVQTQSGVGGILYSFQGQRVC